jgi:hypothetical protein
VGQEPVLFAGTIAENIANGLNDDVLHEELPSPTPQEKKKKKKNGKVSGGESGKSDTPALPAAGTRLATEATSSAVNFPVGDSDCNVEMCSLGANFKQNETCSHPRTGKLSAMVMGAVVRAAKLAAAHEFIMSLPDGYDTDIGANGRMISGGKYIMVYFCCCNS